MTEQGHTFNVIYNKAAKKFMSKNDEWTTDIRKAREVTTSIPINTEYLEYRRVTLMYEMTPIIEVN